MIILLIEKYYSVIERKMDFGVRVLGLYLSFIV